MMLRPRERHRFECYCYTTAPKEIPRPVSHRHRPIYEIGALLTLPQGSLKWCAMPDSHRRELFGRQPGCCYLNRTMFCEKAAAARVALAPPRLQGGALLHELRSV